MRAIGYFTSDAEDERSPQDLEGAFHEYCLSNAHQVVEVYSDGTNQADDGKTGYARMVRYMGDSKYEFLVVVPSARHLGGDLESVARSLIELEGTGAKVTCADDDFPDPIQNAFQTLGIKGVSRTRSTRIRESMRARALAGQALGRPPFGYRVGEDGTLEVVREQAAVVELIFRLYVKDGLGMRLIAQDLNQRGIATRRGGPWSVVAVRGVLRNPAYMGTYTRFGMRRSRAHEAIIDPELFRAAQETTASRRPFGRVATYEPFLLSGMAFCGYCDNKMTGVTRRQSWRRKDGRRSRGVYRYYQCQSRNNQSRCAYHTWRAPLLENSVISQLRQALKVRASRDSGDDSAQNERAKGIRQSRVKNAEARLLRAMKRAARGEVTLRVLGDYLEELDTARRGSDSAREPGEIERTLRHWDSLEVLERQAFLGDHISRIVVKDDEVDVIVSGV